MHVCEARVDGRRNSISWMSFCVLQMVDVSL